ncbi:MAG: hypothetical protein HDT46_07950 [Ruminococcaceae bacterium]|nr:hypothetical protein [Oscillospiraceae bacterium]
MLTAEAAASPASVLALIIHFVGLCPTPYFLFAAQKGSEKGICGFAVSKFSFLVFYSPLFLFMIRYNNFKQFQTISNNFKQFQTISNNFKNFPLPLAT